MEILVLGTSAIKPLPRENCRCSICLSRNPKDRRMRSSILINNKFLIDCGPDIKLQIANCPSLRNLGEGLKIENLKGIFLTHAHEDHTNGLKKIKNLKLKIKNLPELYLSRSCRKVLSKKLLSRFRVKIIKAGKKIKIDNLVFQPLKVIHPWIETFAFKTKSLSGRTCQFVYMPDYKKISRKSLKYFKNIDLLIVGGSSLERKLPWHATIRESIKLFKEMSVNKIYFTHIGHRTLPHQELVKLVKREGGKNFDICFDGQRIKI